MDPERLIRWEPVLQSPFAAALLLLAALLGVLVCCYSLYRENQALHKELRANLQAQGDFRVVLENVREAIDLVREAEGERNRTNA